MLFLKAFVFMCSGEATLAHEMMFGQIVYYAGKCRFGLSETLSELIFQSFGQKPLTGFFFFLFSFFLVLLFRIILPWKSHSTSILIILSEGMF